MTTEQIDKFHRLRKKGVSVATMLNLKHFTRLEVDELFKMFPQDSKAIWHKDKNR